MAKKSIEADLAAYENKGMKAPRPAAYGKLDQSAAPSTKGTPHKEPGYQKASDEMASQAPDSKKKALPTDAAPEGAASVNGGKPYELPKHLNEKK